MALKISQTGINLIKQFEGCQLKAYKCPAGVWTIGWGTTEPINGVKPHQGMVITQAQADSLLVNHLKAYEDAVNKLGTNFNQNQFDALVSFCYNLGTGIFKGNLLKAIKEEYWSNVASQMLLYNKARVNGALTELKGLTRRRQAESELFLKQCVKEDLELKKAAQLLYKRKVISVLGAWESMDNMKLEYVPGLLKNMGGIDRLVKDKIISDRLLWEYKQYNANHIRALIIKYSKLG
ncbi:lysozyme [Cellulosilyticum sp. ST5]|uniref:lysozyme n=1 Tax=Cellulosilyticum sp. ST5 TaxID=3055805 RepID=UPI00397798D9